MAHRHMLRCASNVRFGCIWVQIFYKTFDNNSVSFFLLVLDETTDIEAGTNPKTKKAIETNEHTGSRRRRRRRSHCYYFVDVVVVVIVVIFALLKVNFPIFHLYVAATCKNCAFGVVSMFHSFVMLTSRILICFVCVSLF